MKLTSRPQWQALLQHRQEMEGVHMRDLFAQDASRFDRFALRFDDILFDYSKNRITERTMALLTDLARAVDLQAQIDAMFRGDKINTTENRAVLHVALRNRSNRLIRSTGKT